MGSTAAKVRLRNPGFLDLEPVEIDALADTGSMHLCIPGWLQRRLKLDESERKVVALADGRQARVSYVGPIELRFGNRTGFTGALVTGEQPLLGAIPVADMDLVVVPRTREVIVNPESPDIATSVA